MWFIGVEVEQETSAPPPKKYPGSAPGNLKVRNEEWPVKSTHVLFSFYFVKFIDCVKKKLSFNYLQQFWSHL